MKKLILIVTLLAGHFLIQAQRFEQKFQFTLPGSTTTADPLWVDLDSDGILDMLIVATNNVGDQFLLTYKGDQSQGLIFQNSFPTGFRNASYLLADEDLDNMIDIFFSGNLNGQPSTGIFINKENFTFDYQPIVSNVATILKSADLDQDGDQELIMSGETSGITVLSIYKHNTAGWQLLHDSIKVKCSSIEVFDFDRDGNKDLFVSGTKAGDSVVNAVYYNEGNLLFTRHLLPSAVLGSSSLGDLNLDGNFDILLAGQDRNGANHLLTIINKGNDFNIKDSLPSLKHQKIFAADFNSNGSCDISFWGETLSGDSVNVIYYGTNNYDSLKVTGLHAQRFGDLDHDGDLDLAQVVKTGTTFKLIIFENKTPEVNKVPGKPFNPFSAIIFNRLFLYWEKPADDHTKTISLTYDYTLQTTLGNLVAGEFDLVTGKRLTVSHGNTGTNNYVLLHYEKTDPVSFAVQAIDNSFHAGNSGICNGVVQYCSNVTIETIELCKNERVTVVAGTGALWFSFSKGLLSTSAQYEFTAQSTDTIFSVTPGQGASCSSLRAYVIKVKDQLVKKSLATRYACEGDELKLGVESGWKQVAWSSSSKGFISNKDSIVFKVTNQDTVKVNISNDSGCQIQRSTVIKISKPVVTLNEEMFQILRGESVQLIASGGKEYLWMPASGLDHNNISAPVASPAHTTEYTVTVKDSIGCTASAKITVIVEGTAFVPTLFTPNDDGKNDDLRVYGLDKVNHFSFTIHNREGSIVYETHDINEATSVGWNGSAKGNYQPSGVYYWKVKGELSNGRPVRLNGKSSGSIVLIR